MIRSPFLAVVTLLMSSVALANAGSVSSQAQNASAAADAAMAKMEQPYTARAGGISPNGAMVAFSASVAGVPQLWTVSARGGTPTQVTYGGAVRTFHWSPGSQGLVYSSEALGKEASGFGFVSADGATRRRFDSSDQASQRFGGFSGDGSAFVFSAAKPNEAGNGLYVQDLAGGEARAVFEGETGWLAGAWQPGGDYVIVTQKRGAHAADLYVFNINTQKMIPVYRPETPAHFRAFEWRRDGKGFYFTTDLEREYQNLAYYDIATGELDFLETPEANIDAVSLGGGDRYLGWSISEGGKPGVFVRDLQTKRMVNLPKLPEGAYGIQIADEAPALSISITGPKIPGDTWVYNLGDETLVRVTNASAFAKVDESADDIEEAASAPVDSEASAAVAGTLAEDLAGVQSQALAEEAARQKALEEAQAKAALTAAKAQATQAAADLEAQKAALAAAAEKLEAAEETIKGYDQKIKAAQRKAETAQTRIKDAQMMLDEAQTTLAGTTDALGKAQDERADAKAQVAAAQSRLEAAKATLETAQKDSGAAADEGEDGAGLLEKAKGLVKEAIETVTDAAQ